MKKKTDKAPPKYLRETALALTPDGTLYFLSEEKEKEWHDADPTVRRAARVLLERVMKKSMQDLVNDRIIEMLLDLQKRISELEKK